MEKAIINWYIQENNDYVQDSDFYLGTFTSDSTIQIVLQVWNNRYGSTELESIENARLALSFDSLEDSALLNYCTVICENSKKQIDIEAGRGIIEIGMLSGQPNDGTDTAKNKDNFKNINITFDKFPGTLKNGLKNLYINIEDD